MSDAERFQTVYEAYIGNQPKTSLEAAQKFLRAYFGDADGIEEVRLDMERVAARNFRAYVHDLLAIEELLSMPPAEPGVLANLVAWDANWVLDDPSDEGAKEWLRKVAEMIRGILGSNQPPRPSTLRGHAS